MTRPLTAAALLAALVAGTAGCPAEKHEDTCPSGQTFCAGCRDPASFQTDPSNCGACGLVCGTGTCVGGVCQCEGWTSCPGQNPRCRDTQNDPAHCGTCGLACTKPGAGCAGGACGCYAPRPDDCGTLCTDWTTDAQNCGTDATACGNVCPLTNDVCVGGTCQCPASLPDTCPAVTPTKCVSLANDPQNCGTCGNVCAKTNEVCTSGSCACPVALPDTCGTACVSLANDEQNCGACGLQCATGATCTAGICNCPTGQSVCGTACVDRETDEQNCGTCGTVCLASATCTTGTCQCPAGPQAGCGGACCAGGTACCGSACPPEHSNGLGQTFFHCNPVGTLTLDSASAAAQAWRATSINQYTGFQMGGCLTDACLGWQTANACAVWCYGTDPLGGHVNLNTISNGCFCPSVASPTWN